MDLLIFIPLVLLGGLLVMAEIGLAVAIWWVNRYLPYDDEPGEVRRRAEKEKADTRPD